MKHTQRNTSINDQTHTQTRVLTLLESIDLIMILDSVWHLLDTEIAREDPNKHLKEFHVVCLSMTPTRISKEQVKLRVFPFSLADSAKEWLYYFTMFLLNLNLGNCPK